MKILFLSSEVVPERAGGIASYTATIAPALSARGHDVHVLSCAPEHDRRDDYVHEVWWHRRRLLGGKRAPKLRSYRQTALRLVTPVSCRRNLPTLRERFDVVESPEWLAESLLIGPSRRPVVVNLHTPLHILFSYDVDRFDRDLRVADRLERAAVRRARIVTSSSRLLADTLKADGWLERRAHIVPLPVNIDAWRDVSSAATTEPNVLIVGRLEPRKAPEVAIEAAAILGPHVPGLTLTFVGRSRGYRRGGQPYGDWVAELAEERGVRVEFMPQVSHDQMREFYAAARVVAVPSRFESFSVTALEAMAAARPVVLTSRVGAAEILRGTEAGTEIAPDDPEALAEALRPYLRSAGLAASAGALGREVAHAYCRPELVAEQRERVFEAALSSDAGDVVRGLAS